MNSTKLDIRALSVAVSILPMGCGDHWNSAPTRADTESAAETAMAAEEICYRGSRMRALRVDGELIVEGDILVGARDLWCEEEPVRENGVGVARESLKRKGAGFQWPGGIVPYVFEGSFANDEAAAVAAMRQWEAVVPGIRFVPRSTEVDHIAFRKTASQCAASVGRQGGLQTVRVNAFCISNHSLHHELGHALGLYHQHTRKDRDSFVDVVWSNIEGCPSTATQASHCGATACSSILADCGCTQATHDSESCYKHDNFSSNSARSNIGAYDYDSVMHYRTTAFSKGGVTLDVLLDDAGGNPFPIGQVSHLSLGDAAAVRAMYPVVEVQRTIFSGIGLRPICALEGREEDVAVRFDMAGSTAPITNREVNRAQLLGDYSVSCSVTSTFWDDDYDYPNTSAPFDAALTADSYFASGTLRVLPIGLVPALF